MQETQIEFFKIELAGIRIEVECRYHIVLRFCRNYLASFDKPDFVVRTTLDELIANRLPYDEKITSYPGVAFRFADEFTESYVIDQKIAERLKG